MIREMTHRHRPAFRGRAPGRSGFAFAFWNNLNEILAVHVNHYEF